MRARNWSSAVACAGAMVLLQQAGALAAPVPSPSVDGLLSAPPAGYTALPSAPFHGRFTVTEYAASYKELASAAEGALRRDGFVDGYGLTWTQKSTGRVLLEWVIALKGGSGAKDWLAYEKASDLSHPEYKHADTIAGFDIYYGVHLVYPYPTYFADAFSFVKGNDIFGVGFVSPRDDVAALAATQVQLQHDSAPAYTIPPAEWPENAIAQNPSVFDFGGLARDVVIFLAIVGVAGFVAFQVLRAKPPAPTPAAPPALNQLTPDGNQWWDGLRWVESSKVPPPFAQRTADGASWWDGFSWRPVPQGAQSPSSGR